MARKCEISGTKKLFGNNRSHAMNATKREWKPNLKTVHINGQKFVVNARTWRTLRKKLV